MKSYFGNTAFYIFIFLLLAHFSFSIENISSCGNISFPGYYVINQTITARLTDGDCIIINSSDVILDGNGSSIIGMGNFSAILISTSSTGLSNITIFNVTIINFTSGFYSVGDYSNLPYVENVTIENNSLYLESHYDGGVNGITLTGQNITIRNNFVELVNTTRNGWAGILIAIGGNNSEIFNNTVVSLIDHDSSKWNGGISVFGFNNIIRNNTIINTTVGIEIGGISSDMSRNNTIENNNVSIYGAGIGLNGNVTETVVRNNFVILNPSAITYSSGIYLDIIDCCSGTPYSNIIENNNLIGPFPISFNQNFGILFCGAINGTARENNVTGNNITNFFIGIELTENSTSNLIKNNNVSNSLVGIAIDKFVKNNTIAENFVQQSFFAGLFIFGDINYTDAPENNIIENNTINESGFADMFIISLQNRTLREKLCNNTVRNNTGSGGKEILFLNISNSSIVLENSEYSEVIVCNANNVTIRNVTINASQNLDNNGIVVLFAENITIANISSSGNAFSLYLFGTKNTTIDNITSSFDGYGIIAYNNENLTINNVNITNKKSRSSFFDANVFPQFSIVIADVMENESIKGSELINGNGLYLANTTGIFIGGNNLGGSSGLNALYPITNMTNISLNITFDSPLMNLSNYSNITLKIDLIEKGNNTQLSWAIGAENITLAIEIIPSFHNKSIEINSTNVTINELTFYYTDTEDAAMAGSNGKSILQIWKFNGSDWINLSSNQSFAERKVSLYNFTAGSIYELFFIGSTNLSSTTIPTTEERVKEMKIEKEFICPNNVLRVKIKDRNRDEPLENVRVVL